MPGRGRGLPLLAVLWAAAACAAAAPQAPQSSDSHVQGLRALIKSEIQAATATDLSQAVARLDALDVPGLRTLRVVAGMVRIARRETVAQEVAVEVHQAVGGGQLAAEGLLGLGVAHALKAADVVDGSDAGCASWKNSNN